MDVAGSVATEELIDLLKANIPKQSISLKKKLSQYQYLCKFSSPILFVYTILSQIKSLYNLSFDLSNIKNIFNYIVQ